MTAAMVKRIGLFGGPMLGLLCYSLLPLRYSTGPGEWVDFIQAGRATLGLMVWMAGWWLTEAVDIEATALLPIVTFPLLGIAPLVKVLPPYAADVIFLFIGGIATIVGSPPNGIAVRYIQQTFGKEVSFFDWLLVGGPFTLIFLPIAWLLVTRVLFRADIGEISGGRQHFDEEYRKLGRLTRGEKIVLAVFSITAFLWIFNPLLKGWAVAGMKPLAGLSDAGIAMLAVMGLFLIPADRAKGTRAMNWDTAKKLPWGVLMLFGGGLTLASAIEANGVSKFLGNSSRGLAGLHPLLLLLVITTMTVFLSELTSNTAQVATMVPVLGAMAPALGLSPYVLILACTLGASSAYMMPVGTPPNAIVFGTGLVRLPQMMRAGFWLNLAGILVITALVTLFVATWLGRVFAQ